LDFKVLGKAVFAKGVVTRGDLGEGCIVRIGGVADRTRLGLGNLSVLHGECE